MTTLTDKVPARKLHVRKRSDGLWGYGMLFPSLALMIVFSFYPPLVAIVYSFTNWNGFSNPSFVGVNNYSQVLTDPLFWLSMGHLLIWSILKLIFELGVPLLVAIVIYHLKSQRAQYIYRVLFVIPMVVPGIVQLLIWSFIYDPQVGILDRVLKNMGLSGLVLNWLGSPHVALYALVFVGFPFVIPFNLLIFYAGLQNIPDSVFEAARIDGAKRSSRFFRIELPLLLGQMKLLMILTVIGLLQNIMLPLVLTDGGPGYSTYIPGLYMYITAFSNGQYGLGLAIAMILFVIVMAVTVLQVKFIKPSNEFES